MAKNKRSKQYHRPSRVKRKQHTPSLSKRIAYGIATILIVAGLFYGMSVLIERKHPPISGSNITNASLLHEGRPFDITFGDINAPVTIIEYASLTCGHCKYFHRDVFSPLKVQFIDSGKLRFIYRHYPLNKPALQAALLLSCLPTNAERYSLLNPLYVSQGKWGHSSAHKNQPGALRQLFPNLSDTEYEACLTDKTREEALLSEQMRAQKELGINSTPTIFINGNLYRGQKSLKAMSEAIGKHL